MKDPFTSYLIRLETELHSCSTVHYVNVLPLTHTEAENEFTPGSRYLNGKKLRAGTHSKNCIMYNIAIPFCESDN